MVGTRTGIYTILHITSIRTIVQSYSTVRRPPNKVCTTVGKLDTRRVYLYCLQYVRLFYRNFTHTHTMFIFAPAVQLALCYFPPNLLNTRLRLIIACCFIYLQHWYLIPYFGVRARDVSRARTLLHERTTGLTHAHDVRTHMRAHI